MSADKTDKHQFYGKLDYHYQSVIVPPYVEHIMLVSYTVNTAEYLFHVSKASPLCFFHFLVPVFKGSFRIWMPRIIFNDFIPCYDSHVSLVCQCKDNNLY